MYSHLLCLHAWVSMRRSTNIFRPQLISLLSNPVTPHISWNTLRSTHKQLSKLFFTHAHTHTHRGITLSEQQHLHKHDITLLCGFRLQKSSSQAIKAQICICLHHIKETSTLENTLHATKPNLKSFHHFLCFLHVIYIFLHFHE